MHLPSRAAAVVWAVLVFLAAVAGAFIVYQIESPAAGLSARAGASLPAPAQDQAPSNEHTRSFAVRARVTAAGRARIEETIVQDFGVVPRHGIERVIPIRDDSGVHGVSDLVVSTSAGTPDAVKITPASDKVTIRVGDADTTVTGAHTYRLAYTLAPATLAAGAHRSQLHIDAISAWEQPIDRLSYAVTSPAPALAVSCFEGPLHTANPCAGITRTATGATFAGADLAAFDTFTVRLTWPRAAVAVGPQPSPIRPGDLVYAGLLALAVLAIALWYRRRWVQLDGAAQTQLWATFGTDAQGPQAASYDLTGEPAIEFVPPMGLRPGEMGALLEAGRTEILTATVVDLAARGALKITQDGSSWELTRASAPVAMTDDEQKVMTALFAGGDTTRLDGRRTELGALGTSLAEDLTDDLEDRGLAMRGSAYGSLSTHAHGARSLFVGLGAVVAGCFAHAVVVGIDGDRDAGLVVAAMVAAAVVAVGGWLVVRSAARHITPLGLAALWRVRGFDKFFAGSEAMHAQAAADHGLLRRYMGYAIVFGHVHEWVSAFQGVDTSDWFATTGPLDNAFFLFAAASLWTAPAPTGSTSGFGGGFGGGGGIGGGGGGSW